MAPLPELGVGIVYFPALEPLLDAGKGLIDVIEVEPQPLWLMDSQAGGSPRLDERAFDRLRARPQRKLVHGVGMPLAGTLGLDMPQIAPFLESIARLDPPWISEHLAFLRAGPPHRAFNTGFLLPPLQSQETIETSVRNIRRMQAAVGRPLAFENPANYLRPLPGEIGDGAFLAEIAERADCGILLDLHNLWCNQLNGRQSVDEVLSALPLERVWEVHLAGGDAMDGFWLDAHSGPVPDPLMTLCRHWFPRLPNLKSVVFEIIPDYLPAKGIDTDALLAQLQAIRDLWETRGSRARRAARSRPRKTSPDVGADLPSQSEWENTLARRVNRRHTPEPADATWIHDPAIGILQQLVTNVRAGMLVDLLTLSYRLMVLYLGEPRVRTLMETYWEQTMPEPFAGREAARFARFVRDQRLAVPYLDEVLAYEVASMDAVATGVARQVAFSSDPRVIVEALRAGRRPDAVPAGQYELTVTP
ncbi:DUF692 domain-containing protein [Marilutibacter chinensis]|uniref:DUF692 domain-containing protein n=1 Tax=Marilutibacter chinensis TaxID=2912247 RepID=A0ABS9HRK0_9GAMM|nr:DUF692 family multinuclear iron-containing protein [Lysobacter chinensis]MCF7220717.1 DUF692 domain-containing protein [Lysobacter chinensis]